MTVQCYPAPMKRVAYYIWLYPWEGKMVRTGWKLPAHRALEWQPGAVPVDDTLEWREIPETDADREALRGRGASTT